MKQLYGRAADAVSGKLEYASVYQSMAEVKKSAQTTGSNFNHAVFQALFQHDFIALNHLIANTPNLDATSLDELAVLLGGAEQTSKSVAPRSFTHVIETTTDNVITALSQAPTDSPIKRFGKTAGISLLVGGNFSTPGIVEIGFGGQIGGAAAGSLVAGLEEVITRGDIKQGIMIGGSIMAATAIALPYLTVHESVHGYSATDNYVGLIPQQLFSPGKVI